MTCIAHQNAAVMGERRRSVCIIGAIVTRF